MWEYIDRFKKLGFGMFVHFGLYSMLGKGEWYLASYPFADKQSYPELQYKFNPAKDWAKALVRTAKQAGCRYITLTTRHHDGFSLYDTMGLNTYDAPHGCGRDLVREFVDACNEYGIIPFFYHTLLDWWNEDYKTNFPRYIDYLASSLEILATQYGEVGGFWFDGMWDKPNEDWQEDRIYGLLRKHQPNAMIINNTGLEALGKVGHPQIDSVTFERGNPFFADSTDRPRAGEMCQVFADHWGYAKDDLNYKSFKEIIGNLVDCRACGCNMLLNVGPMANGKIPPLHKQMLLTVGRWIKANKGFIYNAVPSKVTADGAAVVTDGKYYYAIIKDVSMSASEHVQLGVASRRITVNTDKKLSSVVWLDNGEEASTDGNSFFCKHFYYSTSYSVRVARFKLS